MEIKEPECKVVLIGDSGVGKTSIITRYITGKFSEQLISTNGANYASKNVKIEKLNANIIMDIWDTAGQEKYRAVTKFFFNGAEIGILVYEISNLASFESVQKYWYPQLTQNKSELIIGLVGNKADKYDQEEISEEDAKKYADEIGATLYITSSKNNSGIVNLFEDLGQKYIEKMSNKKKENENKDLDDITSVKLDINTVKKVNKRKKCC